MPHEVRPCAVLDDFPAVLCGGADYITAIGVEVIGFSAVVVVLPKSGPGGCHKDHETE